jgi:fructose-1,6-bisphosphatase/inositol monophosphatase family enzyme
MNRWMQERLAQVDPTIEYWSEEAHRTFYPRPRLKIARADPVDGTTNAVTTFSGFAVVLFFEIIGRTGQHVVHLAGAIGSASGMVVSWDARDELVSVTWDERELLLKRDVDDLRAAAVKQGDEMSIASNAAKPARRRLLNKYFDFTDEETWLVTQAGNPIIGPLLLGQLGAVIEPRPVKLHDAAYLVPLHLAGGVVRSLDNQPLGLDEYFSRLASREREVPPFVAAADAAAADRIFLRRRGAAEGRTRAPRGGR